MNTIKVAQVIDSLNAGGAEMVAVNIANELSARPGFESYLIVSRAGGVLEKRIHSKVKCIYLNKKNSYDVKAFWKLYKVLSKQRMNIVHAHSSSFYFPAIIKLFSGFKLVWHDHYGKAIYMATGKRSYPIKPFVRFFDFAFVVNRLLLETDIKFFGFKRERILYLPNFSVLDTGKDEKEVLLKGEENSRIVCLANLRPQKDHLNLLTAFLQVIQQKPNAHLYLIGGGGTDEHGKKVLEFISTHQLSNNVTWLGNVTYPATVLRQCKVGVLASESEGLPLAVIEYGLSGLAVACTLVGEIPAMLTNEENALLVPARNADELALAIIALLENEQKANYLATNLQSLINKTYSANAVVGQIVDTYERVLN